MVITKKIVMITAALGLAPLLVAWTSQYGFAYYPCHLCMLQRYPYMIVFGCAILLWFLRTQTRFVKIIFTVIILAFGVDASIASYHVGVEQHWITGPSGCTASNSGEDLSLEALKAQIMGTPIAMCDNPTAVWFGISMAAWNAMYALAVFILLLYKAIKMRRAAQ